MAGESAREVARRAREKAERLNRRAELFEQGASGEAATADALTSLPPGWVAIHDVRWPGRRLANVDHVVVGPGGIFVIDSKNWTGRITMSGGHLRQNGRSRERAVAGCADAALAIAELAGPHASHVHPVMCFVGEETLAGWCRDVMVCSTSNLVEMLRTRPVVLDAAGTTDAWFRLDAGLRAATSHPAPSPPTARVRHASSRSAKPARRSRPTRRSRKVGPSLTRFLAGIALLFGFLAFGPQLASAIGGLLAEQMTKDLVTPACSEEVAVSPSGEVARTGKHPRTRRDTDEPTAIAQPESCESP